VLSSRRTVFIFYFLFSIFVLLFFTGCGAPGEPAERKSPIPVAVTDLAASQHGNDVLLIFTLPKESIERKPLKHLPAVEIYRAFVPAPASGNSAAPVVRPSNAELLVTIPSEMVDHFANRNQFRYVDTLSAESFSQHPGSNAVYFIRTRTSSKKVSADSNFASLMVEPAPDSISDLKTEVTRDAIVLTWTAPQKALTGTAPPIATYQIYRGESDAAQTDSTPPATSSDGASEQPALAHVADIPGPPFRDSQIQFGKKYVYSVRSVAQYDHVSVDSADSNLASVTRLDTFPPSAPDGLVAALIPAQDQSPAYFDLSWSISPDNDIAGYNIYRSEDTKNAGATAAKNKLNPALLLTPAFRDMNVLPGRRYLYTVTAVNHAGNESPESAVVSLISPEAGAPDNP
jgi:fibronectin type III domain protein